MPFRWFHFAPDRRYAIEPPVKRYPAQKSDGVLHQIEERIGSLSGVESVTFSREALLAQRGSNRDFILDDQPKIPAAQWEVSIQFRGQDFFETMGIPMLYGRAILFHRHTTSARVALINRALARVAFGGKSPIGDHRDEWVNPNTRQSKP